jgi:hypothetical protein
LLSLMENLLRKDLTEIQQAEAFLILKNKLKTTQKALGKMFNKSTTNMNNIMSLNKFPEKVKNLIRKEEFSRRFLLDLLTHDTEESMIEAVRNTKDQKVGEPISKETGSFNNEGNEHRNPPSKKQHAEKVVIKKLESTISSAVKITLAKLTEEDQEQLRELYVKLGKLLMID